MKKTLVSALTTALVVGAASTTFAAANPFSDVPADHWAYDAVTELQAKGVVNGFPDGTYRGNQNMTRYEMAQIIAKALAKVNTPGVVTSGTDKAMVDKLAAEFKDELANLGVRLDELESRVDNVKWSGWVRYEYKTRRQDKEAGRAVSTAQRIKLRLTPSMKVNKQWTAHARMEYGMDANSAHNSTAAAWSGGYIGSQFRVDQAWVDGKVGTATVKLGRFGTWGQAGHGIAMDDTITGAEVTIPFGGNWAINVAGGRYAWYPTDALSKTGGDQANYGAGGYLMGDPSMGYGEGTWTYYGADVYYAKDKWDFGVGYREFKGRGGTAGQFASMGDADKIKIASAGIGYQFSPAVGLKLDYSRVNSQVNDPNQKHSYNVRLDWQATKKIGLYVSYKHLSNPGTMASTYDLQSYNGDGQKGWEFGTDISLQKNVSACAYWFVGKNLAGNDKLRMFYGNLNFKF